ncbi:hypothetical protein [Mycetohabitans sp. B8]|uniref:hypothetical protein n=1 Tax=Mycetohabitans sp. B8 TaxID=2841845 RepID=UPI0034CE1127
MKLGGAAFYPLKQEMVWSWTWHEGSVTQEGYFNVHFGTDHTVTTTSRSDVMRGH